MTEKNGVITTAPSAQPEQPEVLVNLPTVRSFERIVFINEDTGEISEKPMKGYVPLAVPKYIYTIGEPLQFQLDFKDAIFGQVGEDKATFKSVNELVFTPLAVFDFGQVCMYPLPDPVTGQRTCKQRNMVSVIAYLPELPHIVSFLLPTWTASNFLREYRKTGRMSPAGIPITSPLQLQFKATKYQELTKSGTKVWAAKFDVKIMPPKYFKELAEFAQSAIFYCAEHIAEVMAHPVNGISIDSPPLWLRKLITLIGPDLTNDLASLAQEKTARYGELVTTEYTEHQETAVVNAPTTKPEVPEKSITAYFEVYEKAKAYMTEEERMSLAIKRNISVADFKEKGLRLKAIISEVNSGNRRVIGEPTYELPF